MKRMKKIVALVLMAAMGASLCSFAKVSGSAAPDLTGSYMQDSASLNFDNSKWSYDKDNNVYWQIKVGYCAKPETTTYETMGIYVPGAYMTATQNSDGTYTCVPNSTAKVNGYTAKTAPIVIPVNTPGYSASAAPTAYSYSSVSSYLKAGFVYVNAGMRGRTNGYDSNKNLIYSGGAPWGVTDLKAAIRYYRFNKSTLPGSTDKIFTFGMSGGGAQSAVTGATGDSKLYYSYLESIGAAMYDTNGKYISDAVDGSMCWCPITSLDYADEAYEWNMGQFESTNTRAKTTWTSALSKDLAASYGDYINKLGLKDSKGNILTLKKSSDGIYTSGSYYNYLLSVVEGSLNNFISDTKFPYTASSQGMFGAPNGGPMPGGGAPPDGQLPDGGAPGGQMPNDGIQRTTTGQAVSTTAKTYKTVQDYINSLNTGVKWISYDAKTKKAKITSMEAFVQHCKKTSKSVGAFDDLKRNQGENMVFSNGKADALHFDTVLAGLLQKNASKYASYSDWDATVVKAYQDDIKLLDKLNNTSQYRQNMYNPMYYVSSAYAGYKTSTPAKYWRIRTGINQGDTALTVETNLSLALKQYVGVKSVDFETVWGLGHTMAERTGDSTANFISWVNKCVGK